MPHDAASTSSVPDEPQLNISGILTGWIDDGQDTQEVVTLNRHPYGGMSAHVRVGTMLVQVLADRTGSVEIDVLEHAEALPSAQERELLHWAYRPANSGTTPTTSDTPQS
jgi:hypothetical protein